LEAIPYKLRMRYTVDLTDHDGVLLSYYFPDPGKKGRPLVHAYRELAQRHLLSQQNRLQWRNLPEHFGPVGHGLHYFGSGKIRVCCGRFTNTCASICGRGRAQRHASAGSSTARVSRARRSATSEVTMPAKGQRRKRHILVDTLGLLIAVMVLPANVRSGWCPATAGTGLDGRQRTGQTYLADSGMQAR